MSQGLVCRRCGKYISAGESWGFHERCAHEEFAAYLQEIQALRADLAAANARAEEAEQKLCAAKEQLKVACKWLAGSEWGTIEFERVMHEINAMAPHVDNASP